MASSVRASLSKQTQGRGRCCPREGDFPEAPDLSPLCQPGSHCPAAAGEAVASSSLSVAAAGSAHSPAT